ncbi:hypothetical protein C0J50_23453 [Silurus asotus]|uniref:Uncharacterized protein n=1 Tax=Silurus asotus TaxID=30991 RepID=A0AAD5FIK6_SILAS|nr:hypothetical protein C0J50_23453 [Silurus asotus]
MTESTGVGEGLDRSSMNFSFVIGIFDLAHVLRQITQLSPFIRLGTGTNSALAFATLMAVLGAFQS